MRSQTLYYARVPSPGGVSSIYGLGLNSYWHRDWLGSARLSSSTSHTVDGSSAFAPYGETYAVSVTDMGGWFAGMQENTSIPLSDANFRKYNATEGRWLTPDPAGLAAVDLTNPQSLNRYAYVMNNPTTLVDPMGLQGQSTQTCGQPGTNVPQSYSASVYCYNHMGIAGGSGPGAFFTNTADEFDLIWPAGFYGGGNGVAGEFGQGFDPNGAMLLNLIEDSSLPGIGDSGTPQASANTAVTQNACTAPVLGAVNNQFGTSFTANDVQGNPFNNGGAVNLNILGTGLPAAQFNSIQTGRYPGHWWGYFIGYGPTLHITGQGFFDPTAAFTSSNLGGATSVLFTAHIDYGYLFNPFGALYHLFREVLHIGGPRKPC